ncbi:uncharacterized protein FOMMEDRAFT_162683 [Fomitiporia mediterranea MF3/22]|uniref:Uncharacterized protein n=1 Tax=Fomitiporia mediterranea (strain MF3/22) TaxID=694068 RepID=R7SH93_FOMME|nr:uncharacterized protein FOMMEDRAFT_162683 [Fomitiporia mediterranea MF3/22]EJC97662.1 hypothetical protein FOMMEDRAFT_162683 [Fomitiporia mediterranea MF3/22]
MTGREQDFSTKNYRIISPPKRKERYASSNNSGLLALWRLDNNPKHTGSTDTDLYSFRIRVQILIIVNSIPSAGQPMHISLLLRFAGSTSQSASDGVDFVIRPKKTQYPVDEITNSFEAMDTHFLRHRNLLLAIITPRRQQIRDFYETDVSLAAMVCAITETKLVALNLTLRAFPLRATDNCPSAQEIFSSVLSINGTELFHQSFICADGKFTTNATTSSSVFSSIPTGRRSLLETRGTIECEDRQTMGECRCGEEYGPNPPAVSDCSLLLDSITSAGGSDRTFTVPPNGLERIVLQTCELAFINMQDIAIEYCWDDFHFIGEQALLQCITDDEENGVVSGLCISTGNQYNVQLGASVIFG